MTSSDKSINYDLVFQVHHDGSVTVESFHLPSTKPMPGQHFYKDNKININVRGPGKTPLAMKTVEIDFTGGADERLSPIGDADNAKFVWRPGQQYTHVVPGGGVWNYTATLTTTDGKHYFYPGLANLLPEFQVGDGI